MSYLHRGSHATSRKSDYRNNLRRRSIGTSTLVGSDVYNYDDEHIGDVKEIMLNLFTGEIAYVVLSFGGIFGLGEKLFAIPWKAYTLDSTHQTLILNESKERLENAPGFDKECWPNMAEKGWINEVHTFYETRVYSFEEEY